MTTTALKTKLLADNFILTMASEYRDGNGKNTKIKASNTSFQTMGNVIMGMLFCCIQSVLNTLRNSV